MRIMRAGDASSTKHRLVTTDARIQEYEPMGRRRAARRRLPTAIALACTAARAPEADGSSGFISGDATLCASYNHRLPVSGATLYRSATNLTDKAYLVSRVNGAFAGVPRQVFAGARFRF